MFPFKLFGILESDLCVSFVWFSLVWGKAHEREGKRILLIISFKSLKGLLRINIGKGVVVSD